MTRLTEHEAFALATDSIARAVDALKIVAEYRADERDLWLQVAQTLGITKESIFRLAGDGTLTKRKH